MIPTWAAQNGLRAGLPLANLAAAFDASLGITSSGGFASAWADQSGNGRNLLQATGANQPAVTTNSNGACVRFNGTTQFIKCAAFALSQPETVYIVERRISFTANDEHFDGDSINTMVLYDKTANPSLEMYAGASGPSGSAPAVGTTFVAGCVFNGADSSLTYNNGTATTGNVGAANAGGFTLGSRADGTFLANIDVHEVLIYNVAHDAATRSNIIRALMSKWGIA